MHSITDRVARGNNIRTSYPLQSFGYGYCPVTETILRKCVVTDTPLKEIDVHGTRILIPAFVDETPNNNGSKSRRFCFQSKTRYEQQKTLDYGFEAGIRLIVDVASAGRWTDASRAESQESSTSLLFQTCITSLRLPEEFRKYLSKDLKDELMNLPQRFELETSSADKFAEFFQSYGTHLIIEQPLGGEVVYDFNLQRSEFTNSARGQVRNRILNLFQQLPIVNNDLGIATEEIASMGRYAENLNVRGGNPQFSLLTSENFSAWQGSISGEYFVELEHGFKLLPFYKIVSGRWSLALKEATRNYLENGPIAPGESWMERRIRRRRESERKDYWLTLTARAIVVLAVGIILGKATISPRP